MEAPMKTTLCFILGLLAVAFGMTPREFAKLYATPDKNAETCYKLYEAYNRGDGVPKNDSQARKWILAAHGCGMISARKEIAALPWRKLKKAVPVADPGDEVAQQKGEELIRLLVDWHGTGRGGGIVAEARQLPKESMKTVKRLVEEGADLNVALFNPRTLDFHSALSLACQNADLALARYLIDHGADPSSNGNLAIRSSLCPSVGLSAFAPKGKPKRTPQEKLCAKVIAFLANNGADLHMWTNAGWSVAMIPTFYPSASGLAALLKAGADPDLRMNPNEYVRAAGNSEHLQYCYLGGRVRDNIRPITFAIDNCDQLVVAELIKHKADLNTPENDGLTPLGNALAQLKDSAAKNTANPDFLARRKKIVSMLKAAGAAETPEAAK